MVGDPIKMPEPDVSEDKTQGQFAPDTAVPKATNLVTATGNKPKIDSVQPRTLANSTDVVLQIIGSNFEDTPKVYQVVAEIKIFLPLFGFVVAISGDTAVVGAPGVGTLDTGLAYWYKLSLD